MEVREARIEDVPALALMGKEFFLRTKYAESTEYDYASIISTLGGMIREGSLFVAVEGEEIKAFLGLVITPVCWNRNLTIANELFWWGSPRAMVMVHGLAEETLDVDYLCMSTLNHTGASVTRKFYEKKGYENMGDFYMKDMRCLPSS